MDLVFEIGCEELPAAAQPLAMEWMKTAAAGALPAGVTLEAYATPRRLALVARNIPPRGPERKVQGPPARVAFADGKPTKAAEGFARKTGVPVTELKIEGDKTFVQLTGIESAEVVTQLLAQLVRGIPFRKTMRWGEVEAAFARPVHWIAAALDGQPLSVEFGDVKSAPRTRGHRFHAPEEFDLPAADRYLGALRERHVLADWAERKAAVWREVQRAAAEAGGEPMRDDELLETVTGLVEEPTGVHGSFDAAFLELPPEVLVSEMRGHQKYFAVQQAGKLAPAFVAIANTRVRDPSVSRRGYERVLRARLADARFFFDEDRKTRLLDRAPRLERIVFLQGLGSQWQRVERIRDLALWLNGSVRAADDEALRVAAALIKSDLTTGMVGEFPDLQGVMGREYARREGAPEPIAQAIFEHYLPRGAEDRLPEGHLGALLGMADRIDQLVGIFGLGKEPTGTADPYGLRRAAIGLIRVILHKGYRFDLREALRAARVKGDPERVFQFLLGRLQAFWSGDFSTFEIQMALGRPSGDLLELQARLKALRALRGSAELQRAAAAFKRIDNILRQAQEKKLAAMGLDPSLLQLDAEKALLGAYESSRAQMAGAGGDEERTGRAFAALASLGPPLESFFDDVMVMDPDPRLRDNRLALLRLLHELFAPLADFSKLQA